MNYHEHSEELIQRAVLLFNQHNYELARKFAEQAVSQNPSDSYALFVLALILSHIENQEKKALDTIEAAIALSPEDSSYHCLKAFLQCKLDRYTPALKTAELALSLAPDSSGCFIEKGRAYMGLQQWTEAEQAFRNALAIDPDDIDAGNMLTISLQMQQRGSESKMYASEMLQKDPLNAYSHSNAGWAALRENDLVTARQHFLEALRLEPGLNSARAGIIETFKAQSPIYRAYLNYVFFMSRFQNKHQFLLIFGFYIAYRALYKVLAGYNEFLATALLVAYLAFALWSWVARGVGNFFLFLNSFARKALTREETLEAVVVGGSVSLGLPMLICGIIFKILPLFLAGASLTWSAFPFSICFTNSSKPGKYFYGSAGFIILITGILSAISGLDIISIPVPKTLVNATGILGIAVIWLGSFGFLRK